MKSNTFVRFAALALIVTMFLVESAAAAARLNVVGSGASFPYQIYSLWFMLANRDNKDMQVDYIAKGSGSGIKDFQNHAVDFAASDAAMNDKEIQEVKRGYNFCR